MRILSHTFGILVQPASEWRSIRKEHENALVTFLNHVPLLALIPVLATFYGTTHIGWEVNGKTTYLTQESALMLSVISYFANLALVIVLAEFINWMTKTYSDDEVESGKGMAIAVYIMTPVFLSGIIFAYPDVWICAAIAGLGLTWSVYLCFKGVPILMKIPEERGFIFSASIMTSLLVLLVVLKVASVLVWELGFGPIYSDYPSF